MTYAELLAKCAEQIALAGPETVVVLVLRRRRRPKCDTVRLLGRRGPVGRIYSDIDGLTVGFVAREVVAFIEAEEGRS